MKRIYLLRHGKAESSGGSGDHERALAPRGLRDSMEVGTWMAAQHMTPDQVLVSSAIRTQQTFERWRVGAQWSGSAETDEGLYLASGEEICARIAELDDGHESVLVIGHNPGLEMAVRRLSDTPIIMRTSTLASLVSPLDSWAHAIGQGACELSDSRTRLNV
jgi:phosphohistidine phosphatase